jgi:hypothetical protein
MKVIFCVFLSLFLSFGAFAQKDNTVFCTELVRQSGDEKEVITLTNKSEIRLNDLHTGDLYQLAFLKEDADFSLVIRALDEKCFNENTPIKLFFRDGTQIQLFSNNRKNCKSVVSTNLGLTQNNKELKQQFLEQYLIGVQYLTQEGEEVKLKVGTPQNEMIQELFECITK